MGEEPRKGMRERRMNKEEERETMNAVLMTNHEEAEREKKSWRRKESDRVTHTFDVFPRDTDREREREGMNNR